MVKLNTVVLLLVFGVVLGTSAQGVRRGPEVKIEELDWLAGTWKCQIWGGTFEETWMAPSGGTIQGLGKHVANGRTSFMEFMSIEMTDGVPTMWMLLGAPSKGEKKGVPFKLTSLTGKMAVFENPKNDNPSKITYELKGKDDLLCTLEGEEKGKPAREVFEFKRG